MKNTNPAPRTGILPLSDLSPRLRSKISCDTPKNDRDCCWIWTGAFRKSAERYAEYHTPDDYDGHRNFAGCVRRLRGMPIIRPQGSAHAIAAYRVVLAEATGRAVCELGQLTRCTDSDRCVSPYHTHETARPVRRPRRPSTLKPEIARPGPILAIVGGTDVDTPTHSLIPEPAAPIDALAALVAADVDPNLDAASAAEEAGIPAEAVTDDVWAKYVSLADPVIP